MVSDLALPNEKAGILAIIWLATFEDEDADSDADLRVCRCHFAWKKVESEDSASRYRDAKRPRTVAVMDVRYLRLL